MGLSRSIIEALIGDLKIEYSDQTAKAYRDLVREATTVEDATHTQAVIDSFYPNMNDWSLINTCSAYGEATLFSVPIPDEPILNIVYEKFRQEPYEIELRTDIPSVRIALYEDSETVAPKVNALKPTLTNQNYLIDISVVRAYRNDKANYGELVLVDWSDRVKEWAKTVDAGLVTNSYILALSYEGASRVTRNPKYVTKTLNCSALRDLSLNQTA